MGTCSSSQLNEEERAATTKSKMIDKDLQNENRNSGNKIKLLLLGAGESGKSTIFKQMKILHGTGFSEDDRMRFKWFIWSNIVECAKIVCDAIDSFGYTSLLTPAGSAAVQTIRDITKDRVELDRNLATTIKTMWQEDAVKKTLERGNEFQLMSSSLSFISRIDTIASQDYLPSIDDVLLCRIRTTGVHEENFLIKGRNFCIVDVGGQRSERRKWMHCFTDVNAVIFVAALSEFNEQLFEDSTVNRMTDALSLFETVCNSQYMRGISIILFLNKIDIFREKIAHINLADIPQWSDYSGTPKSYEEGLEYFLHKFTAANRDSSKRIYHHYTCATNTDNMKFVLTASSSIIIEQSLEKLGFSM